MKWRRYRLSAENAIPSEKDQTEGSEFKNLATLLMYIRRRKYFIPIVNFEGIKYTNNSRENFQL